MLGFLMDFVDIRPHHLLDILRDYGNGVKPRRHPFGASVIEVTERIIKLKQTFNLVPRVDSICITCSMIKNMVCQAKIRDDLLMREYNDNLDDRLFEVLGFKPFEKVTLDSFIMAVNANLNTVLELFTSPDNNRELRKAGTIKGINLLS